MMDAETTLRLLGHVTAELGRFSVDLGKRRAVRGVTATCRPYLAEAHPGVEWYVDAELASGEALSWGIVFYHAGPTWMIEGGVQRIRAAGAETEVQIPARRVDIEQIGLELGAAVNELISTASSIDLEAK